MLGDVAWRVLFNEELEDVPDPNKPENQAYVKAKRKERKEKLEKFFTGDGKVVFDEWQKRIQVGMFTLLTKPIPHCECELSRILTDLQGKVKMLAEVQSIIEESKNA